MEFVFFQKIKVIILDISKFLRISIGSSSPWHRIIICGSIQLWFISQICFLTYFYTIFSFGSKFSNLEYNFLKFTGYIENSLKSNVTENYNHSMYLKLISGNFGDERFFMVDPVAMGPLLL